MKNAYVLTVVVFLVSTILFSWWFINKFGFDAKIGVATLKNIVIDRALLISIPVSVAYFCIHMLWLHEHNKWKLAISIVLILGTLYTVLAYFFLFHILIVSLFADPFVD